MLWTAESLKNRLDLCVEFKCAGKEGKFRAKEEEEAHRSPKTRAQAAMEIERDIEVHSVITENLQDYTVHGGQKVTDEHGHKKFLPYQTVAAGGHGTEVVPNLQSNAGTHLIEF